MSNAGLLDLGEVWARLTVTVGGDLESDWCQAGNYYQVYQELSAAFLPGSILEIGTRVGHSLIALGSENPRLRRIRWVDNETYVASSNVLARVNLGGFYKDFRPDWPLPEIDFSSAYPDSSSLRGQFDLCHVDGDHSYAGKLRDLEYCRVIDPLWIMADDFDYHAEARRALGDWCSWSRKPLYRVATFRGLALIPLYEPLQAWTAARLATLSVASERVA